MKCNICDAPLSEPKLVEGLGKEGQPQFDPCDACMAVIEDTLASYEDTHLDKPAADESELGGPDPIFEELYPQVYDPFGTDF